MPPEKFVSNKDRDMGPQEPLEPKTLILNSADELYSELRDKNFSAVGQAVSRKAKIITAQFDVCVDLDIFSQGLHSFHSSSTILDTSIGSKTQLTLVNSTSGINSYFEVKI